MAAASSHSLSMRFCRILGLVLLPVACTGGCGRGAAPTAEGRLAVTTASAASATNVPAGRPQPKLPTVKLWLGAQELAAEVARTPMQVQTGMMFRKSMAENEAMLFVFAGPHRPAFWMKNTLIPLSCAYIDSEGTILEIHDMKPKDESPIQAESGRVQYVLEVNQGWFERNKVGVGTVVRTEHGSLTDTFFKRR